MKLEFTGAYDVIQRNFDRIEQEIGPAGLPQARVYKSAAQSIPNTSATALTFNSERFDEGAFHSTTSNTTRLTAPSSGLYLIGGWVVYAANATGFRIARLTVDGTTDIAEQRSLSPTAPDVPELVVSTIWQMDAGSYAELKAFHNSGGALNVIGAEFWMVRLGGLG